MTTASEITDDRTLAFWLEGRSRQDAVCITHRAAMRHTTTFHRLVTNASALLTLRPLVVSAAATRGLTPELEAAAASAAAAAGVGPAGIASAYASSYAAEHFTADDWHEFGLHEPTRFESLRRDCEMLEAGEDPLASPLWSGPVPADAADLWAATRAVWEKHEDPVWSYWIRWYENALESCPQDWSLLHDIALIANEDWRAGPGRVHPIIERMLLERAISVTRNAEAVVVSGETGKLRLVPASNLPEDMAEYARRKIRKAVGLFEGLSSNQYSALAPDLAMLTQAVDEAANLPVELFDACASASRRLRARVRNGECPPVESDPLIADYLSRIREAGADVLAHDPKTREVLAARNATTGNDALIEHADAVRATVEVVLPMTEAALTIVLSRDAALATDPGADAEDRKDASVRLSGRLLRVGQVGAAVVAGGAGLVLGTQKVLEAIAAIQVSPVFQQAVQAILRYLGY